SEVRKLAAQVLETCPRLEIRINSAGTAYAERSETVDGFESTFAVNHLGSFLLTKLLMDRVIASAPARIVNTASTGHYQGHLDFEDLGYTKGRYSSFGAYARSKLANVAFTIELGRRLEGKGVATISMHPGAVATNIWANVKPWQRPIIKVLGLFFISSEEGGGYLARLAIEPSLQTAKGLYVEKTQVKTPSKEARDPAVQAKLWEVSEAMVAAKV
ncbi:MAG: SDR family NAD(P)-dependent oxidoreductase, partial [Deltaproteobacteria bacterium]|nr:SDR family NAD(P)-dependent oxidoreductase [Deltaproteobacteria bacterium]